MKNIYASAPALIAPAAGISRTARACPRLQVGMKYFVDGDPYIFDRHLDEGQLVFKCVRADLPLRQDRYDRQSPLPDAAWLNDMVAAGRFSTKLVRKGGVEQNRRMMSEDEARQLDPVSVIRYRIMVEADRYSSNPDDIALLQVIKKALELHPHEAQFFDTQPTLKTVRHWLKNRGSVGDRAWADCISNTGRGQTSRLPPPLKALIAEAALLYWADATVNYWRAYARLQVAISMQNAKAELEGRFEAFDCPDYSTFRRYVDRFASVETVRAKLGDKAAKAMQAVGKLPLTARILEAVQGDHTIIDILIRDDVTGAEIGRPTLTIIIDVKSRCILGYYVSFDPPSFGTFAQCFKRCLTPKVNCIGSEDFPILQDIFGLPSVVVLDNAMEFTGISTQDAMNDLGVVLIFPPVKTPEAKPFVERLFGTLNSMGFHSLEGTTLNQAQKTRRGGEYKPAAAITLNALHEIIDHVIHAYHISAHAGLNGLPPAHVWQEDAMRHGIPVLYDLDRIDSMLAVAELRVLARDGIQLHGLMYNHGPTTNRVLEELTAANFDRRQKLKVKYNPHDLGCIWFYHPLDREYLRLPCTDPDYASGLSLYQHKSIETHIEAQGLRFSTTEQRLRARQRLENKIYQITPGLVQKHRKSLARLATKAGTEKKLDDLGLTSVTGIALLPHETLQARVSDNGASPKGARRGAAKAEMTRQRNTERRQAYDEREAQINDQHDEELDDFDDSDWKGYDYE